MLPSLYQCHQQPPHCRDYKFFPSHCNMPTMMATNWATLAATQLVDILKTLQPNLPFPTVGAEQMRALKRLAETLQKSRPKNPTTMPLDLRVENTPIQSSPQATEQTKPTKHNSPNHQDPLHSHSWKHKALQAILHQTNPVFASRKVAWRSHPNIAP